LWAPGGTPLGPGRDFPTSSPAQSAPARYFIRFLKSAKRSIFRMLCLCWLFVHSALLFYDYCLLNIITCVSNISEELLVSVQRSPTSPPCGELTRRDARFEESRGRLPSYGTVPVLPPSPHSLRALCRQDLTSSNGRRGC